MQVPVAVKAMGTEGEREARAEEIEVATTRRRRTDQQLIQLGNVRKMVKKKSS